MRLWTEYQHYSVNFWLKAGSPTYKSWGSANRQQHCPLAKTQEVPTWDNAGSGIFISYGGCLLILYFKL